MTELKSLFENNNDWAKRKLEEDPEIFSKLAKGQSPKYLWIGCSDSRVPPTELLGLEPGDIFVHRNIANLFPNADFSCLSVLEYAVGVLGVEHVIVCGHYGCGGVKASMENAQFGLIDNWLRHIRDVSANRQDELEKIQDPEAKFKRLVELNVLAGVRNICHSTITQNAWEKGQKLTIHGWVYDLSTGLLKDLDCAISSVEQVDKPYLALCQK